MKFAHFTKLLALPLLLISVLLTGCATTSTPQPQLIVIPEWVKNPPSDNAEFMYGIGEGYNVKNAQQNALKDIAGKIATNINSQTEDRVQLTNGRTDRSFNQKVNTSIADIKLTDYEVVKTEQQQSQVYMLVAMSRSAFITDKKNTLNDINVKIDQELKGVSNKSQVEKLFHYNSAIQLANQARPLLALLRTVDPSYNVDKYVERYNALDDKERVIASKTSFHINRNPKLDLVSNQIKKALQTNGFKVSSSSRSSGKITLNGTTKEADLFGNKNVVIEFSITLETSSGKFLSRKDYRLNGSSATDYTTAKQRALNTLTAKLSSKSDVYSLLGLQN